MKMEKIEGEKQLPIGAKLKAARVTRVDSSTKRVELQFDDGKALEFGIHSYNELSALVTASPAIVDKWIVTGRMKQITGPLAVNAAFDREGDATDFVDELYAKFCPDETAITMTAKLLKLGLALRHVRMPEDEADETAPSDDVPF